MTEVLRVDNLTCQIGNASILEGITLSAASGEIVALVGPNGAGKSTLLKCLIGLVESSGVVLLAGEDRRQLSHRERAKRVSYVPQQEERGMSFTVSEFVEMGLYADGFRFGGGQAFVDPYPAEPSKIMSPRGDRFGGAGGASRTF